MCTGTRSSCSPQLRVEQQEGLEGAEPLRQRLLQAVVHGGHGIVHQVGPCVGHGRMEGGAPPAAPLGAACREVKVGSSISIHVGVYCKSIGRTAVHLQDAKAQANACSMRDEGRPKVCKQLSTWDLG